MLQTLHFTYRRCSPRRRESTCFLRGRTRRRHGCTLRQKIYSTEVKSRASRPSLRCLSRHRFMHRQTLSQRTAGWDCTEKMLDIAPASHDKLGAPLRQRCRVFPALRLAPASSPGIKPNHRRLGPTDSYLPLEDARAANLPPLQQ